MPATPEESELHKLIINGDEIAFSKLYSLYSEDIFVSLKNLYPGIAQKDDALIMEAVSDGFLGYYRNAKTFNPKVTALKRFLHIACERDLINILDKEARKTKKMKIVEVGEHFWTQKESGQENPETILIQNESEQVEIDDLRSLLKSEIDIELAILIRRKERKTEMFSKILKIDTLPTSEQQKIVKQNKDRIKAILKRNQKT